MKKHVIFAALLSLAAPLFSGCSDDDTAGPEGGEEYLVLGNVLCRPYVDFSAVIHDVYRKGCNIDSVLVGDSLCRMLETYNMNVFGEGSQMDFYYSNRADSTRFDSGELITVKFFDGAQAAVTQVSVLSWNDDSVKYISPPPNTAINPAESFELVWHRVANAHWYGLKVYFLTDSSGEMTMSESYTWTADTSIVIDGSNHPKDGQVTAVCVSVSGPCPGFAPNVSGLKLTGTIYSLTNPAAAYITVGTGLNPRPVVKMSPCESIPDSLATDLVERLYDRYSNGREAL